MACHVCIPDIARIVNQLHFMKLLHIRDLVIRHGIGNRRHAHGTEFIERCPPCGNRHAGAAHMCLHIGNCLIKMQVGFPLVQLLQPPILRVIHAADYLDTLITPPVYPC